MLRHLDLYWSQLSRPPSLINSARDKIYTGVRREPDGGKRRVVGAVDGRRRVVGSPTTANVGLSGPPTADVGLSGARRRQTSGCRGR
jgi:hypothetical protein